MESYIKKRKRDITLLNPKPKRVKTSLTSLEEVKEVGRLRKLYPNYRKSKTLLFFKTIV